MSKTSFFSTIVVALLLVTGTLSAQQPPDYKSMQPYGEQTAFTAAELSKFMTDWPDVVAWGKQHNLDVANADSPAQVVSMFAAANFTAYLQSKGWKVERFGYVATEAALCLGALELQAQMPDIEKQMKAAIDQVNSDTSLTKEQKQQTIQMMENSRDQVLGILKLVHPTEVDLVKPKQDDLKTLFSESSN